ncbi:MAG: PhzF family phenazine biosynthesis protein [Holosporales bacterium]|jgi:PhzF family phenazine biosynthesis protein|nr:PhzF family phenazine biosynthesis protein [Holosporales bacterium]
MHFWIIDTFTSSALDGNPAGVCLLEKDLAPAVLQKIAREFNVHETAFVTPLPNQHFQIQIFTPTSNDSICGHSLLATAHVLWNELTLLDANSDAVYFDLPIGIFMVTRNGSKITVHVPAKLAEPAAAPDRLINALGTPPIAVSKCEHIYVVEMFNPRHVLKLEPDIAKLEKIPCTGVVVTAEGGGNESYDFMSRFFAPAQGVKEDPTTLWNHCFLGPYWAHRLGKDSLVAYQTSGRSGTLMIECQSGQVRISGECVSSVKGTVCNLSNWSQRNQFESLRG